MEERRKVEKYFCKQLKHLPVNSCPNISPWLTSVGLIVSGLICDFESLKVKVVRFPPLPTLTSG